MTTTDRIYGGDIDEALAQSLDRKLRKGLDQLIDGTPGAHSLHDVWERRPRTPKEMLAQAAGVKPDYAEAWIGGEFGHFHMHTRPLWERKEHDG